MLRQVEGAWEKGTRPWLYIRYLCFGGKKTSTLTWQPAANLGWYCHRRFPKKEKFWVLRDERGMCSATNEQGYRLLGERGRLIIMP